MALLFAACDPNAPATSSKVETGAASDITTESVVLHGKVNVDISQYEDVEFGMMVSEDKADLNARDGEMYKAKVLIGKDFELTLEGLSPETKYYYCAWVFLNNTQYEFGDIKSFETKENSGSGSTGNHEYVDLGLSVKWATCNVGASKPEEYGDYFAWGETQPKSNYDWSTYKWCNGSYDTQTKYNTNSSYGTVDNKTTLDLGDDAARANWGGSWRMPTDAELTELREQCTWTWTTQNGVYGYKVTSKKSGYTNKSIFLPAAGYRSGSSLGSAGSDGDYWSSSLLTVIPSDAWYVGFGSSNVYRDYYYRYYGFSVRPVCQ
jgi:hypothetical protein